MKVSKIEDIKEKLAGSGFNIVGIGGNPSARSEIWPFVSDLLIVCSNKSGEFDSVSNRIDVKCFHKLKKPVPYAVKKPEKILKDSAVVRFINDNFGKKRKIALYLYKSTVEIENICKKNNWLLIGNLEKIFKKVDDKKTLFNILKKIHRDGCSDVLITKLSKLEDELEEAFKKFGRKIVLQLLNEGGGRGTFFFEKNEKSKIVEKVSKRLKIIKKEGDCEIIINKFYKGPSLSVTGCITKDNGILISYAQYQLIDIKEAIAGKTDGRGIFCGHDWGLSNNIPEKIHKQCQEYADKIGRELAKEGCLGIFGVDFIWELKTDKIIPLEINPRLLGTFPTAVHVQLHKKEVPLVAFHLLDFLGIKYKVSNSRVYMRGRKREGAHLIVFNPFDFDVVCQNELKGGIYKVVKNSLVFMRNGFEMADIRNKGEFVLTDGVPTKDVVFGKNRKIFKIITRDIIAKNRGAQLNNWGKNIVETLIRHMNFKQYEKK